MFKLFMTIFIPVLVLMSGLISCSGEKKTVDVYNPPPPNIKSAGGTLALMDWNDTPVKNLDLQDSIDVTEAHADKLRVISQCGDGNPTYNFANDYPHPTEISIFKIIPEEIFFMDFAVHPVACNFELRLINSEGSTKVFRVNNSSISDLQKLPVEVVNEAAYDPNIQIRELHLRPTTEGYRVRYSSSYKAAAQVICSDVTTPPLPFSQVEDLARFDLRHPNTRQGRDSSILEKEPVQYCRVMILNESNRTAVSPRFQLRYEYKPFEKVKIGSGSCSTPADCERQVAPVRGGDGFALETWQITNPSFQTRYVRFSKTAVRVSVSVLKSNFTYPSSVNGSKIPNGSFISGLITIRPKVLILYTHADSAHITTQDDTQTSVLIEPGQSLLVFPAIWGRAPLGIACDSFSGFVFDFTESPSFEEITAQGESLGFTPLSGNFHVNLTGIPDSMLNGMPKSEDIPFTGWAQ